MFIRFVNFGRLNYKICKNDLNWDRQNSHFDKRKVWIQELFIWQTRHYHTMQHKAICVISLCRVYQWNSSELQVSSCHVDIESRLSNRIICESFTLTPLVLEIKISHKWAHKQTESNQSTSCSQHCHQKI